MIFGAIGAAAGIVAIFYAHAAVRGGRATTDLAEEANKLAKGSNTIALDARRIAIDANEYSHRAEKRETERHDVYWEGDWTEPGLYVLTKRGDASAHMVKATVTYDGTEVTTTSDLIADEGDGLEFRFPTAAADFADEVSERRRRRRQKVNLPFGVPDIDSPAYDYHSIRERVDWVTAQGTPKLHEEAWPLASFGSLYPD